MLSFAEGHQPGPSSEACLVTALGDEFGESYLLKFNHLKFRRKAMKFGRCFLDFLFKFLRVLSHIFLTVFEAVEDIDFMTFSSIYTY